MTLDCSEKGVLTLDMTTCVKEMIDAFEKVQPIGTPKNCPWTSSLFEVDEKSPPLSTEKAESFHTFVAKALFLFAREPGQTSKLLLLFFVLGCKRQQNRTGTSY